jgi:glutamate dehydrogenase (NAD(P)+)
VTGKPVALGGSLGRDAATGRGVVIAMNEAVRDMGNRPDGLKVAIQGFGNVGSWAARLAEAEGYDIVAVSDVGGGVYDPRGLRINDVLEHARESGTVATYAEAEPIDNEQILELDVDVLIPAALGEVIHKANADRVRASLVMEAANHPVTPVADRILNERGITVVPDILANAGGVTVSYFEWTQNIQQFRWDEGRVNTELRNYMVKAYQQVREYTHVHGGSLRQAGFAIAVERVAEAARLRGYV